MADPLILAAALDAESFARLDADRRRHFPAALNRIPAHLTLFHHLPGENLAAVSAEIARAADRPAIGFTATGHRFLGRGVAVEIAAPDLVRLRADLAGVFADHLTPQDRQGFRPHVTIQNKVAPAEARDLFDALQAEHRPWRGTVTGLDLWFYRGGPWERAGAWTFSGAEQGASTEPGR